MVLDIYWLGWIYIYILVYTYLNNLNQFGKVLWFTFEGGQIS